MKYIKSYRAYNENASTLDEHHKDNDTCAIDILDKNPTENNETY